MATKVKEKTSSQTTTEKAFIDVNERKVDDISLEFFYTPHAITLLLACIIFLTILAISRDPNEDADYICNRQKLQTIRNPIMGVPIVDIF